MQLLDEQLATVTRLAKDNELPDAILTESGLKITPLDAAVPDRAQALIDQTSQLLPRIKITELLMDVDDWTGFSRHFTHLKDGAEAKDRTLLLSAILGDAINLGLTKMAESSPGLTYAKLSWLQARHIRDETYSAALAELVNHQYRHAFAAHWGDGTTSSSDGQRFRAGGRGESTGHVNPKYGSEPGRLFYTHISDQYAPFSTRVVNVGVRDSTYVLDGLLYHESDLRIEEHYTDTAGFTDHVFALMHLLGFRFAPRIRDLGETKLYVPQGVQAYPTLRPLIGGTLNIKHVRAHWDDILRPASSIKQGTVTASLMLRKLGSYPRQNGLAVALRELGRIERTLFIPDWLQSVELRRRVHAGLNKGEARNSLAGAVFFNRLGEIRDRSFEQQRYRASGLNLVTAAIVLWNTVYRNAPPGVGRGRQAGGRRAAAIPVAAGLGAHQPNRRLRLAAEPQTGRREVSALTDARKTLAYDFFRILRAPLICFFRWHGLQQPVGYILNLLVARQFLQAVSPLAGCGLLTAVAQCLKGFLFIPALSGRMNGEIFILAKNTFPDERAALFTLFQLPLLLFVQLLHVNTQNPEAGIGDVDVFRKPGFTFTIPGFLSNAENTKQHLLVDKT